MLEWVREWYRAWRDEQSRTLVAAIREAQKLDPALCYILVIRRGTVSRRAMNRLYMELGRSGVKAVIVETR